MEKDFDFVQFLSETLLLPEKRCKKEKKKKTKRKKNSALHLGQLENYHFCSKPSREELFLVYKLPVVKKSIIFVNK